MRESAQKQADEAYQARVSALVKSYKEKEQELSLTFDAKNQDLLKKISIEAGKLADLQAKQLSYIQAKQRQEEIDSNQDYYRLALDEIDINDITLLRELQPRFVKKESTMLKMFLHLATKLRLSALAKTRWEESASA